MNTEERKRLRKEYSKLTNAERTALIDAIPVLLDDVDRLEAENAALKARVEKLEEVRKAAEFVVTTRVVDGTPGSAGVVGESWRVLKAALAAARGE